MSQERSRRPESIRKRLQILGLLSEIFRPHFSSTEEWQQYQPPQMMKRVSGQKLPRAYIVYNVHDDFGLNGAPEIGASDRSVFYEPRDGGHCHDITTEGMAHFLSDRPLEDTKAEIAKAGK